YCKSFTNVYQVFDNHFEGVQDSPDYLYKNNPNIPITDDLYKFPNQKNLIEKRYRYNVDVKFFKKILDEETYQKIKKREDKKLLKQGELYRTTEGNVIVYIN